MCTFHFTYCRHKGLYWLMFLKTIFQNIFLKHREHHFWLVSIKETKRIQKMIILGCHYFVLLFGAWVRRKVVLDCLMLGIYLWLLGSKCSGALGLMCLFCKTTIGVGLVALLVSFQTCVL